MGRYRMPLLLIAMLTLLGTWGSAPTPVAAQGLELLPSVSTVENTIAANKAPATVAGIALDKDEQTLWSLLLAARAKAGLPALALNTEATALARDRSTDMANRAYFGHVTPDGKSVFDMLDAYKINFTSIGETIAMNLNVPDSGAEAAKGLFASPAHYAILFDKQFTAAGVGHGISRDGKHYYTIVIFKP